MRLPLLTLFCVLVGAARDSSAAEASHGTIVYGGSKTGDGWALGVDVPAGWKEDCCNLANQQGVNLLIYPADWDGHESIGLIKLTVWDKAALGLKEEWAADEKAYRLKFPGVQLKPFAITPKALICKAGVYTASDKLRDYVVYCDLGKDWRYRLAWSYTVRDDGAAAKAEQTLRNVVASTVPMHLTNGK